MDHGPQQLQLALQSCSQGCTSPEQRTTLYCDHEGKRVRRTEPIVRRFVNIGDVEATDNAIATFCF